MKKITSKLLKFFAGVLGTFIAIVIICSIFQFGNAVVVGKWGFDGYVSSAVVAFVVLVLGIVLFAINWEKQKKHITSKTGDEIEKNNEDAKKRPVSPFYLLFIFFAISACIFLGPVVCTYGDLEISKSNYLTQALVIVHNVIKLFVIDSDFALLSQVSIEPKWLDSAHELLAAVYFVAAPVFTAVTLLSFVKDFFSMLRIRTKKRRPAYIFSELNEMSLAIASDIVENEKNDGARIIFTDVYKKDDEKVRELIVNAEGLGAVCLSKDIVELRIRWFAKSKKTKYYLIGSDQDENMKQAINLVGRYNLYYSKKEHKLEKVNELIKKIEGLLSTDEFKDNIFLRQKLDLLYKYKEMNVLGTKKVKKVNKKQRYVLLEEYKKNLAQRCTESYAQEVNDLEKEKETEEKDLEKIKDKEPKKYKRGLEEINDKYNVQKQKLEIKYRTYDENTENADLKDIIEKHKSYEKESVELLIESRIVREEEVPEVYVYAMNAESEMLLDNIEKKYIHVRRINENRNIVFQTLIENSIFDDVDNAYRARRDEKARQAEQKKINDLKMQAEETDDEEKYKNLKAEIKSREKDIEKKIASSNEIEQEIKEIVEKEPNGEKQINVAIIGLGGYGMELLKTLSWLGQAKGYYLNAFVFDGENATEKLRASAPDMLTYNYLGELDKPQKVKGENESNDTKNEGEDGKAKGKDISEATPNDARYSIHFYNKVDVKTTEFLDKIAEIDKKHDLVSIYVTLGNDSLNIQTAMAIRRRLRNNSGEINTPNIYAVVFNDKKTKVLKHTEKMQDNKENDNANEVKLDPKKYYIKFIGNLGKAFSQTTVEQHRLEDIGKSYHTCWASACDPYDKRTTLMSYDQYEYYRRSSMAQALFYELTEKVIEYNDVYDLARYEHNRWNAFMRADGFTFGVKDVYIGKTHKDLKPFSGLKDADKRKDFEFMTVNKKVKIKSSKEPK